MLLAQSIPRLPKSALTPAVNRWSKFLDRPTTRNIICQPALLDDHQIVRRGNVVIASLAKGSLGEDVATFFVSALLGRLQLAILPQAEIPPERRRPCVFIVDEFHAYADDAASVASLTSLFPEARKYGASLVVAPQYPEQIHPEIRAAMFGNIGTLIGMRCSLADAKILRAGLGGFTTEDILNLGMGEAIVRMGRSSGKSQSEDYPKRTAFAGFSRRDYWTFSEFVTAGCGLQDLDDLGLDIKDGQLSGGGHDPAAYPDVASDEWREGE